MCCIWFKVREPARQSSHADNELLYALPLERSLNELRSNRTRLILKLITCPMKFYILCVVNRVEAKMTANRGVLQFLGNRNCWRNVKYRRFDGELAGDLMGSSPNHYDDDPLIIMVVRFICKNCRNIFMKHLHGFGNLCTCVYKESLSSFEDDGSKLTIEHSRVKYLQNRVC